MSDLWRQFNASHRAQLIAAAVVSGLTVGTLVVGLQALEREGRLRRLKRSLSADGDELIATSLSRTSGPPSRGGGLTTPPAVATLAADDSDEARVVALARRARAGDFDEDLILEQLARNRVFLTDDGLSRLRDAFVVVVGCGGVGSHCAAALARSGVSRIRLIDFDQVTLSSLNRHAVATLLDVGTPKVKCLERRLAAVAPWVRFDLRGEKFDEHVAESMLGPWAGHDGRLPDFVVDAIDNIDTKVELLRYCHSHSLPIIASMGAGCKSDPTRIVVGDIGTSTYDRLSRATRRRLKLHGIVSGIPAVFSTEEAGEGKAELLPVPEEEFAKGGVDDLGVMPSFRVRILPVLGTMPAVFGYTLANHVILAISGYPTDYVPAKGREKMYEGILSFLQGSEDRLIRSLAPDGSPATTRGLKLPLTHGDVAFLVEELNHGRSAVTGVPTKLVLVRWRRPASFDDAMLQIGGQGEGLEVQKSSTVRLRDLACMTKEEAMRHEKEVFREGRSLEDAYGSETVEKVERRLAVAERYEQYRGA